MSPGVLILINGLSIPFISEAETLGELSGKFPKLSDLVRLRQTRRARWFKGYLVLVAIWFGLIFAPTVSGKKHEVSLVAVVLTIVVQIFIWTYVIRRIKSSKKN